MAFILLVFIIFELCIVGIFLSRSEQKGLRYLILISGANYLYTNMILATYHIRELTLLVNENYTNLYDTNRTRDIANHIGTLARIYQAMILGYSLITANEEFLEQNAYISINNNSIINIAIINLTEIIPTNLSLSTSVSLLQSSILRIYGTPQIW